MRRLFNRAAGQLPVTVENEVYRPQLGSHRVVGLSSEGVAENFPTTPPVSLYGATQLCKVTSLEYADAFGLPIWINRCGVLAGVVNSDSRAGNFCVLDQLIFATPAAQYIGFDGQGHQVRDCLHPRDVAMLVWKQIQAPELGVERVQNVSGGVGSAMSLAQLSGWCARRFADSTKWNTRLRPNHIPWPVRVVVGLGQSEIGIGGHRFRRPNS